MGEQGPEPMVSALPRECPTPTAELGWVLGTTRPGHFLLGVAGRATTGFQRPCGIHHPCRSIGILPSLPPQREDEVPW